MGDVVTHIVAAGPRPPDDPDKGAVEEGEVVAAVAAPLRLTQWQAAHSKAALDVLCRLMRAIR
jgi:hypothetical protein